MLAADNLMRIWQRVRRTLNLTQESAAAACGWTQGNFGHYLHGRIGMSPEAVLKIARVLEVDPVEIDPEIRDLLPTPKQNMIRVNLRPAEATCLDLICRATDRSQEDVLRALILSRAADVLRGTPGSVREPPTDSRYVYPQQFHALSPEEIAELRAFIDRYRHDLSE